MYHPHFFISVAILSILTSSKSVHCVVSYNTPGDKGNLYKHDALVLPPTGMCSGSIISDYHILTAAHCVVKDNSREIVDTSGTLLKVITGISNLADISERCTFRLVEKIYLPNFFVNLSDGIYLKYMTGDFAILKLNHRLGLGTNPRIEALKFAHHRQGENEIEGNYYVGRIKNLKFTGFGITGFQKSFNPERKEVEIKQIDAKYLHYSTAKVLKVNECSEGIALSQSIYDKFCAILTSRENSTTCSGDSGGALFDDSTKEIIGVNSLSGGHCNGSGKSFFTKIVIYANMIEAALNDTPHAYLRRESFENDTLYQNELKYEIYKHIYTPRPV